MGAHAASHCSAVAFAGEDALVSASNGPFAPNGAIYCPGGEEQGPLVNVAGVLSEWLDGKADARCIATNGSAVTLADGGSSLYVSADTGRTLLTAFQRQAASLSFEATGPPRVPFAKPMRRWEARRHSPPALLACTSACRQIRR